LDSAAGELVSQDPTQHPKSKAFALLDALEGRDFAPITSGAVSADPVAASVVRPDALRRDGGDVVMSVSEVKAIMEQLTVLRTLDERSTALSVAINFAYWKLGVSYQAFADVSLPPNFLVLRLSWRDSADVPIWVPRFILERNRKCSSICCATNLTFKWRPRT
jgi:hypothetical protein